MNAAGLFMAIRLALGVAPTQLPEVPLVEVGSADEREGWSPHEMQPLEDAVVLAFNGPRLHLETRRSRISRSPPAIYVHAQALQGCANPHWPKTRVIQCVRSLNFPRPHPRRPQIRRATHLLRLGRRLTSDGVLLFVTLASLGRDTTETQESRLLGPDASAGEERTALLELAGTLLRTVRPRPVEVAP